MMIVLSSSIDAGGTAISTAEWHRSVNP
jgi:hypothetical protein